jgi:hypothetical protein
MKPRGCTGRRQRGTGPSVSRWRTRLQISASPIRLASADILRCASRSPQPNDFRRAQIVHEAVHTSFDLASASPTKGTDEARAYRAETVYIKKDVRRNTASNFPPAAASVRDRVSQITP